MPTEDPFQGLSRPHPNGQVRTKRPVHLYRRNSIDSGPHWINKVFLSDNVFDAVFVDKFRSYVLTILSLWSHKKYYTNPLDMINNLSWYLCACLSIEHAAEASVVGFHRNSCRFALQYATASVGTPGQEVLQAWSMWTRSPFFEAFFCIESKIYIVPHGVKFVSLWCLWWRNPLTLTTVSLRGRRLSLWASQPAESEQHLRVRLL